MSLPDEHHDGIPRRRRGIEAAAVVGAAARRRGDDQIVEGHRLFASWSRRLLGKFPAQAADTKHELSPGGRNRMFTLLVDFADKVSVFNVFRYITFRTGGALITSALIVFMFGPTIINSLRLRQGKGQPIRADGPQTHFKKAGTPTMGGLMILSRHRRLVAAVGEPLQRLCLGRAAGDAGLRRDRLLRRLSQGDEAVASRLFRQGAARRSNSSSPASPPG